MIDFPIDDLLDEEACLSWLEQHLRPRGLGCPRCGASGRRFAQQNGAWPAWRCQACDRYYTPLTGTVFEKTRQPPSKVLLLLRGIAKGEPTARLAREPQIGRARIHQLRQRMQRNLLDSRPQDTLPDEVLEADELDHNAGEKSDPHGDPHDPPRRRAK